MMETVCVGGCESEISPDIERQPGSSNAAPFPVATACETTGLPAFPLLRPPSSRPPRCLRLQPQLLKNKRPWGLGCGCGCGCR